MRLPYRMEIIPDIVEGGFAVRFPELPGCLTCSDTLEGEVKNAEDCKREWLRSALKNGTDIPEPCQYDEDLLRIAKERLANYDPKTLIAGEDLFKDLGITQDDLDKCTVEIE